MDMSNALAYEYFIRNVFQCERGEDPAHLADADISNLAWIDKHYFNKAKTGVAYTWSKYYHEIMDEKELTDPEDYDMLDQILDNALSASDMNALEKVIDDAKSVMEELQTRAER